jgi:hypothetical protein
MSDSQRRITPDLDQGDLEQRLLARYYDEVRVGDIIPDWRDDILQRKRRWVDLLLQCCIYASLDVVPVALVIRDAWNGDSFDTTTVNVCVWLTGTSCCHVAIYYCLWSITDIVLKVQGFRAALRRDENGPRPHVYAGEDLRDIPVYGDFGDRTIAALERERACSSGTMDEEALEGATKSFASNASPSAERRQPNTSDDDSQPPPSIGVTKPQGAPASTLPRDASGLYRENGRPTSQMERTSSITPVDRRTRDEKMNLCVHICGVCQGAVGELGLIIFLVLLVFFGVSYNNKAMVGVGVILFFVNVAWIIQKARRKKEQVHKWLIPDWWRGDSNRLWALQAWGETHCSLRYDHTSASYAVFGSIVLLQCVLFSLLNNWTGIIICGATVAGVAWRQYFAVHMERPWGCVIGLSEALANVLIAGTLNAVEGREWAIWCYVVACLRQFGLARHKVNGNQIARCTVIILNVLLFMVIAAALFTVGASAQTKWTGFCKEGVTPNCQYTKVLNKPTSGSSPGLMCHSKYELGNASVSGMEVFETLSLADFALLSALAYESPESLTKGGRSGNGALDDYFTGWTVVYNKTVGDSRTQDWTTFYEFADRENATGIISVRGTNDALDVLNDINIWTPAVIMQAFSALGPTLVTTMSVSISYLSGTMFGESFQKDYFSELLSYVDRRVREDPDRRFYITGHSLGGGLAKLVASRVGIQAITFMSPGIATTSFLVFGNKGDKFKSWDNQRHTALTVMPKSDIVSRVDNQIGMLVQTDCSGTPAHCHLIYPLVCGLTSMCGSGRTGKWANLFLPSHDIDGNLMCGSDDFFF